MNSEDKWGRIYNLPRNLLGVRKLLAVYLIINSIGLIVISMFAADILAELFFPNAIKFSTFYEWARPQGNVVKLKSALQYILPVVALIIFYSIFLWVSRCASNASQVIDKKQLIRINLYFWIAVIINGILLSVGKEQRLFLGIFTVLWLLQIILTLFPVNIKRPLVISVPNWFLGALLCVISVQYVAIFYPLIAGPMLVGNDYINIPEKTILKSGRVVDNIEYINDHGISGLQIYDPRKDLGSNAPVRYGSSLDSLENRLNINAKIYSEEELEFIKLNNIELTNQMKAGWFLYHHGYSFGPMNALALGASPYELTMVYGWLNTVAQSKVLEHFGMLNYQGYFKVSFAAYIAYFVVFVFGIWAIFRRVITVVFAAILVISAVYVLGIEVIRLAPGFNPLRHFFDVPVFYFLYRYLENNRRMYLLSACVLALFSILWSKDFGLFLTLSVGGAILFKWIKQQPFKFTTLFVGVGTLVAGMLLYFYPMPGANPTAIYMFLGVGTPQIASEKIFIILIIVNLLLLANIWLKQEESYTILSVGMALYFVQCITYYIWYPSAHHIFGVAPVYIFWLVVLFNGWVSQDQRVVGVMQQSLALYLLVLFVYLPATAKYYINQGRYNNTYKSHLMYEWSFKNVTFTSTMEPTLFQEAANLIDNYSKNNNAIYILSKYDHILPILAGKYSAMPYNELPTNLVSFKEIEVASGVISTNKPAHLFVDSDIGRNLGGEVPLESDIVTVMMKLYGEARARMTVLRGLTSVYASVADQYRLCESGRLISVYCRNTD